jgi:hypothetical protein
MLSISVGYQKRPTVARTRLVAIDLGSPVSRSGRDVTLTGVAYSGCLSDGFGDNRPYGT